jgi:hypothetical protein
MNANKTLPFDLDDPEVYRVCRAVSRLLMNATGEEEARRTILAVMVFATGEDRALCCIDSHALVPTVLTGATLSSLSQDLERIQTMLDNCRVDQGPRTFLTLECESPHPEGRTDGAGGTVWLDSCCCFSAGWTNAQGARRSAVAPARYRPELRRSHRLHPRDMAMISE